VTQSQIHPRPDQIAELTRGLSLPLPMLNPLHMKVIASGLALAARSVSLDHPAIWTVGSEAEINAIVETRLNRLIDEDSRWNQLVDCVVRGKETLSFDGSHLETRPDLSIFLTNRSRAFPLVVECKLIEVAVGKNEGLYCTSGLSRFVTGKYGWGGQEAMMLGYVRDGSTIDGLLIPYLTGPLAGTTFATQQIPQACGIAEHDIAASLHGRNFTYIHAHGAPGSIAVWHIWVGEPVAS
jgi:hypothetical protein